MSVLSNHFHQGLQHFILSLISIFQGELYFIFLLRLINPHQDLVVSIHTQHGFSDPKGPVLSMERLKDEGNVFDDF
jgi:hypothetical protein